MVEAKETFDLVFLDADKPSYIEYFKVELDILSHSEFPFFVWRITLLMYMSAPPSLLVDFFQ